MKRFEELLHIGKVGESIIATWLRSRGHHVVPVYEIEQSTGKGPRLFAPDKKLIAPDMLVFKAKNIFWIEAKHKTAFSWHRKTSTWVTGIDLRYYADYCEIADTTFFPVWLMFLQQGGHAKDSPETSPAGLFGNELTYLRAHESHRWSAIGHGGMVYWKEHALKKLATLETLQQIVNKYQP